ncbi:hypothetical protein ONZ45_g6966 [Pleurotus djamor]|nr:hypothetical protein ONZ45_g6966 [Pleurotus djamor]
MTSRDDDEDSLFGSPPPEVAPAISRGRSPSPLLALPGISTATPSLASSTSTPVASTSRLQITVQDDPTIASSEMGHQRSTRTQKSKSVTQNTRPPRPPPKKKPKKSSRTSTRTHTPQIQLPDSSSLLPPNFLRNQTALFGLAGLVGRIKPATLMRGRGTTRDNPIVIDPPRDQSEPVVDPSPEVILAELPTLTTEEIVAALVNEKALLPLLESILKLHSSLGVHQLARKENAAPRGAGLFYASLPPKHAKKRRKLEVPAGAADWDIPYPFSDGEENQEYRLEWERARGRKLVKEFVELVRSAAEEAARKKHLARSGSTSLRHYRRHAAYSSLPDASPTVINSPSPSSTNPPSQLDAQDIPPSLFDFSDVPALDSSSLRFSDSEDLNQDFLSNWMSMLEAFPDPSAVSQDTSLGPTTADAQMMTNLGSGGLDDIGFDWLGNMGGMDNFSSMNVGSNLIHPILDGISPPDVTQRGDAAANVASNSSDMPFVPTIPDAMIDPQLWAISGPSNTNVPSTTPPQLSRSQNHIPNRPPTPSLSISSIPSLASPHMSQASMRDTPEIVTPSASVVGYGDAIVPLCGLGVSESEHLDRPRIDKGKRREVISDFAMDVDERLGGGVEVDQDMLDTPPSLRPTHTLIVPTHPSAPLSSSTPAPDDVTTVNRPQRPNTRQSLRRATNRLLAQTLDTSSSIPPSSKSKSSSIPSTSSSSSPAPSASSRPNARYTPQEKQNILRDTKERLMLLKAEYERAKVEFWECGLEHACLVQMGKQLGRNASRGK